MIPGRCFPTVLCLFVVCLLMPLSSGQGEGIKIVEQGIRKSLIAGSWYPGNPGRLRSDIEKYLDRVPAMAVHERVIAVVSPHAGYAYSGQVAAHAYKPIEGRRFDTVVVIGPSHRTFFKGASIYGGGGYETPLGVVPIDRETARRIESRSDMVSFTPDAHRQEHSVEIQLPFLQVVLGAFRFVPIVMGVQDEKTCRELAGAVAGALEGREALIVGSSDLSHFKEYERAVELDSLVLDHMKKMDSAGLLRDLRKGACEACGGGPIAVTMMAAQQMGADGSRVVNYQNSGDVTGDRSSVVGYAAAVFYRTERDGDREHEDEVLGTADRERLLQIARDSIASGLAGGGTPQVTVESNVLKEPMGAFVTLKKRGQLRGCIGYIKAMKPLFETVSEMAQAAAFDDPRFPPLKEGEMDDLAIEISVLTPLQEIADIEDIVVGRHGIYIVRGFQSGLLLPQVATEHRWDRVTFLKETCHKAGLSGNAWRDKETKIYIFSAHVFGETG